MSRFDDAQMALRAYRNSALQLLGICFVAAMLLHGQAFLGSISGIVTDATGAVVAGAAVTITDVDRNTAFSSVTNETGLYAVRQLPIGRYRIVVEKPGFRRYTVMDFPLAAEQRAAVDVSLAVGAEAVEVTVTAAPQLVESTTSTLSGTLPTKTILDLPLNNRIFALRLCSQAFSRPRRSPASTTPFTAITSSSTAPRKPPAI